MSYQNVKKGQYWTLRCTTHLAPVPYSWPCSLLLESGTPALKPINTFPSWMGTSPGGTLQKATGQLPPLLAPP